MNTLRNHCRPFDPHQGHPAAADSVFKPISFKIVGKWTATLRVVILSAHGSACTGTSSPLEREQLDCWTHIISSISSMTACIGIDKKLLP
jgi:hypothetical protein